MAERASESIELFIQPDIRRKRVTISTNFTSDSPVQLSIAGGSTETLSCPGEIQVDFPEFEPWTPENPTLYSLSCEMDGAASCEISFGMRECTVKDHRITLNQRGYFIHGATFFGAEDIGAKVAALKGAGFNAMLTSASENTEALLATADELGLLVWLELGPDVDVDATVPRLRNHPSLVAWIVESGKSADALSVRALDPSRLILMDTEDGESSLLRPYQESFESFEGLRLSFDAPLSARAGRFLSRVGESDELSLVLRLGEGSVPDANRSATAKEALEQIRSAGWSSIDALRSNPAVAGYFLERRAEAMTTPDGTPGRADLQPGICPIIHMSRRNLTPREEASVSVTLANEERLEGRADLSLQVVGPTQQVLWKKKRGVKIPRSGKELWSGVIAASGSTGPHRFVVRLMDGMKRIAENSVDFFVFEPTPNWDGEVHVLGADSDLQEACSKLASPGGELAPVHVVPPLANTIRGYPEDALARTMGRVHEGAVVIFFEPPEDWNDLAAVIDSDLATTSIPLGETVEPTFHVSKLHPLFDGLPAGHVMGGPFRDLLPQRVFAEAGEEDICECVERGPKGEEALSRKGNAVLVLRYGSGRVVFTHLRILDRLGADPVADRLFVNLLRHFSRRSVRSGGSFPVHQKMVKWLRKERVGSTRRWMAIGPFANWGGAGHEAAYPPEETIDLEAAYAGWFCPAIWRPWFTQAENEHVVKLGAAMTPVNSGPLSSTTATGYAYAECISDSRCEGRLSFEGPGAVKIWINEKLVFSREESREDTAPIEVDVFLKQGSNALLVKQSVRNTGMGFSLDISAAEGLAAPGWW